MIRLWHDDIRPPPGEITMDSFWDVWVRTNEAAMEILKTGQVSEISLDHDLGLHELDPEADEESIFFAGRSQDGSGYDLVDWMCETGFVPPKITIHSWNPDGARRMAKKFNEHGHDCIVQPFRVP